MNMAALAALWVVVQPILAKIGKGIKAVGKWFSKYWKEVCVAALFIGIVSFAWNDGYSRGTEDADTLWTDKYNESVDDFNNRMKALKGDSDTVVDVVNKATDELGNNLDNIDDKLANEAKKPQHQQQLCVEKATLNTELPPELFKAWADMNEAGATHNPYADLIKETK